MDFVAGGSDQPIPAPWPDWIRHVSTAIIGPQQYPWRG